MGNVTIPKPVKLIITFIFKEEDTFLKIKPLLMRRFGKVDFESPFLEFTHTDYYAEEFGVGLKRKILSFKKNIPAQTLADIKLYTNKL